MVISFLIMTMHTIGSQLAEIVHGNRLSVRMGSVHGRRVPGNVPDAIPGCGRSLATRTRCSGSLPPRDPSLAASQTNAGAGYILLHRMTEADAILNEAEQTWIQVLDSIASARRARRQHQLIVSLQARQQKPPRLCASATQTLRAPMRSKPCDRPLQSPFHCCESSRDRSRRASVHVAQDVAV